MLTLDAVSLRRRMLVAAAVGAALSSSDLVIRRRWFSGLDARIASNRERLSSLMPHDPPGKPVIVLGGTFPELPPSPALRMRRTVSCDIRSRDDGVAGAITHARIVGACAWSNPPRQTPSRARAEWSQALSMAVRVIRRRWRSVRAYRRGVPAARPTPWPLTAPGVMARHSRSRVRSSLKATYPRWHGLDRVLRSTSLLCSHTRRLLRDRRSPRPRQLLASLVPRNRFRRACASPMALPI